MGAGCGPAGHCGRARLGALLRVMPDSRSHRGPHPRDLELFAPHHIAALRAATEDLSWLLSRGYSSVSALKLCGDRHGLTVRQRMAVSRSACSEQAQQRRSASRIDVGDVSAPGAGAPLGELWVDGFNVLLTVEVALGGGPVFLARDGCLRDIASVHGTYRKVVETEPAVGLLTDELLGFGLERVTVLLDAPVSNSGRLAGALRSEWARRGLSDTRWQVLLVPNPDAELVREGRTVASADGAVLDGATAWVNLARRIVDARVPRAFRVDLETSQRQLDPAQPDDAPS